MSRKHTRRLTTAACGLALLAALSACGSGSDEPSGSGGATSSGEPSESSSGGDAAATEDLADPGEDLLARPKLGVVFKGTDQRLTWRFPESYESKTAQQATSGEGPGSYEMTIGFKAGTTAQAEGESVTEGMEGATVEEVQVRDKTMVTTAADTDSGSLRTFFWTPDGSDTTYAVLFYAVGTSVADTPAERLDELYQTIGTLAVDDQTG